MTIEAYRIGVNLVMDDSKVLGSLGAVFTAFEKIQSAQRATQANLNTFASGIRAATNATNGLADAWNNVASAVGRAASRAGGVGGSGGGSGSAPSLSPPPLLLAGPRSGQLMLTGPGGGGMPSLNYTPPGAGGAPNSQGPSLGTLASRGMTALYIVDRLVTGIGHLIEKADKFNDSLVVLEQRGVKPEAIAGLERTIMDIAAQVPGATLGQVGADAGSLRAVLGEGAANNPAILKHMEEVFAALGGGGHPLSEGDRHLVMRAIEMGGGATDPATGKISPEKFAASLDAIYKALMAAGNVVGARDLLNLSQQGAIMAKAMGDYPEFLRMMIAPLIDMKGSRAGTALQAAGRQMLGGIGSTRTWAQWEKDGILPEGSFTHQGSGFATLTPEAAKILADGMKGGLQDFIEKVIRPALIAKGITDPEAQNVEITKLAGTDPFRRLLSIFLSNADQVLKDQGMMDNVPAVAEGLKTLSDKSIGFNITAMSAATGNFLDVLEKAGAGPINELSQGIGNFFKTLTGMVDELQHFSPTERRFWFDPNIPLATGSHHSLGAGPRLDKLPPNPEQHSSLDNPIYVHVANASDIGRGVSGGLAQGMSRPQSGPTYEDYRMSSPMPGSAIG